MALERRTNGVRTQVSAKTLKTHSVCLQTGCPLFAHSRPDDAFGWLPRPQRKPRQYYCASASRAQTGYIAISTEIPDSLLTQRIPISLCVAVRHAGQRSSHPSPVHRKLMFVLTAYQPDYSLRLAPPALVVERMHRAFYS